MGEGWGLSLGVGARQRGATDTRLRSFLAGGCSHSQDSSRGQPLFILTPPPQKKRSSQSRTDIPSGRLVMSPPRSILPGTPGAGENQGWRSTPGTSSLYKAQPLSWCGESGAQREQGC